MRRPYLVSRSPSLPGTDRRAALVVGASFSHHARVEGSGRTVPGMPDPQPQAPPTNPAPEPTTVGNLIQNGPTSLALLLAPGGLSACLGVHRPPGPRAG